MNKTNSKVLYLTQVTLKERAILSQNEFLVVKVKQSSIQCNTKITSLSYFKNTGVPHSWEATKRGF